MPGKMWFEIDTLPHAAATAADPSGAGRSDRQQLSVLLILTLVMMAALAGIGIALFLVIDHAFPVFG